LALHAWAPRILGSSLNRLRIQVKVWPCGKAQGGGGWQDKRCNAIARRRKCAANSPHSLVKESGVGCALFHMVPDQQLSAPRALDQACIAQPRPSWPRPNTPPQYRHTTQSYLNPTHMHITPPHPHRTPTLPPADTPTHLVSQLRLRRTHHILQHEAGAGDGALKPVHAIHLGGGVVGQQAVLTEHLRVWGRA
jgi:hypothetical protein